MSEPIIYKGRGTPEMYDDMMDFLNYVFCFNGNESDFKKLLPKLYKVSNNPCHSNYVVTEDGKLKAAIGAYDDVLLVDGEEIKCRGIGNVAVHPYSRSKGYMIDCMNMAIENMIKDGVDISLLGGQRQRYGYFGFEQACPEYGIRVTRANIRHNFRNVPVDPIEIRDVTANDTELLDKIEELQETRPMRTVRAREELFDILRSWQRVPRVFIKNGEVIGYCISNLTELTLTDMKYFDSVVRAFVEKYGDVNIQFAEWNKEMFEAAIRIGEGPGRGESYMVNILNFKKVVSALLKFKAAREELIDGEFTVLIHGCAGDCKLKASVKDGKSSVEDYEGEADLELTHHEAIKFFFGIHSFAWKMVKPEIRTWFPLPLYIEGADHV